MANPSIEAVETGNNDVITVTASRKQVAVDRRSYDVSVNADAATITASEAIARLPGVITDIDGNFSILGDSNISYLVDGSYFPREIALEIPAKQIERIELVTNPGASERSGGITINIILRKEIRNPRSLTITGRADTRDRYSLATNLQRETDNWKSVVQFRASSDTTRGMSTRDSTYLDPTEPGDTSSELREFENQSDQLFLLTLFSRKLGGGGKVNFGPYASVNRFSSERSRDFTLVANDAALLSTADRRLSDNESQSFGFNVGYSKKTDEENLRFMVSAGGGQGDVEKDEAYRTGDVAGQFDRLAESSYRNLSVRADREVKRPDGSELKYGLTYRERSRSRDFAGRDSLDPDNALIGGDSAYDVTKLAAFASLQRRLGDWTVLPGLRYESITADIRSNGEDSIRQPSFHGFLPSLHISRSYETLGELKASVARKVQEPFSPDVFDPARRQTGYRFFSQNDANIGYGDRLSYEISHEWEPGDLKMLSTLYYRDVSGGTAPVTEFLGDDAFLTRFVQVDESLAGLNINAKQSVTPKFDYAVDLNVFERRQDWVQNGQEFSTDDTSFTIKTNSTYRFTDQRSLLVTLQYVGEKVVLTNTNSGQLSSSFKFVQNFPENLSFTVEGIDILASDTQTIEFISPTLDQTRVTDTERRGLRVSLSKRF